MLKNKDGIRELRKPLIIMAVLILVLFVIEVVYRYYAQLPGHFSRGIMDEYNVYLLGGLVIIWLFMLVGYIAVGIGYRRAAKDTELRKSGVMMQAIEEKKQELEQIVDRLVQEQQNIKRPRIKMDKVTQETTALVRRILELDERIRQKAHGTEIDTYARGIKNVSSRLLLTLDNIQDMSRMEEGKLELKIEEYSLKAFIEEIYAAHSSHEELQRIQFCCQASSDLPSRLLGDRKRIRQVLDNLLVNSASYTKKGSIKLSLFGKVYEDKVHLLFSVKDTGIGIEEEKLRRLSQDFAKDNTMVSQVRDDTELGLYLSNGILHLMGSELHVVSIHGQGSEFYFELDQEVTYGAPVGRINLSNRETETGV